MEPAAKALSVPWNGPAIGLLDLDAFFASVEQLDHPEWRGKPVIVGGDADRRGVVSTASYEARQYGVHSAMPAATARRLCPNAIWTHGSFSRYREVSNLVMDILVDETPLVEQVSIDEAFFDITPGRYSKESPIDICRRIQKRVASLGVTCSIGIGVCKTVAKIASEMEKPRGLTVVLPGTEAGFLAPLPVRSMSGIGPSGEAKLILERELGSLGVSLRERAAGTERSRVGERAVEENPKSISNERTFAADLTREDEILPSLDALCAMVARRLRRKGLAGSTLTVKIKNTALSSRSAQSKLSEPTDDESAMSPVARELLEQLWSEGDPVRLLGVGISNFADEGPRQLDLFEDPEVERRKSAMRKLHEATDALKERFGDEAVAFGREMKLKGATTNTQPQHKEDD